MKNVIELTIGGISYTVSSAEPAEYIKKVAAYLDARLKDATAVSKGNSLMAAVLAGLTVSDDYYKERAACESLRGQLKKYSDEIDRLRVERDKLASELRAEQKKKGVDLP